MVVELVALRGVWLFARSSRLQNSSNGTGEQLKPEKQNADTLTDELNNMAVSSAKNLEAILSSECLSSIKVMGLCHLTP